MNPTRQRKLREAGWGIGSASDFLQLSEAEEAIIEMKLALASNLKDMRLAQNFTQQQLAKRIGSSQSRVAKMECADKSVSIELIIKSLISLGATTAQVGQVIALPRTRQNPSRTRLKRGAKRQPTS